MKKEVTIKDIAKKLGIHHATVSRALQGSAKVNEKTRELILQAAKDMGYTPNILAQNFRNGKTKVISFIIPDLKHHFFSRIISMITEMAREKGFMIMIFQSNDDPNVEKDIINSLISLRVAGVAASVGLRTASTEHFDRLTEENIPLVYFDRVPKETVCSTIVLDNGNAMKQVVDKLVRMGKRKIAYISYDGYTKIFEDRLTAYFQSVREAGLSYEKCISAEQIFIADGYESAAVLFNSPDKPDAIVCINDEVAIGVIKYLKEQGVSIPAEVAVAGFDDNPMGLVCDPELTTLSPSINLLSESMLNLLLREIESGENIKEDIVLPLQLLERGSA